MEHAGKVVASCAVHEGKKLLDCGSTNRPVGRLEKTANCLLSALLWDPVTPGEQLLVNQTA